jgi:hypothetical protein
MDEAQKEKLVSEVQEAAIIRDFCKHSGFAVLRKELDSKINDLKNSWLTAADPATADKYRVRAQVYNEVLDCLKAKIIKGDMASKALELAEHEETI